MCPVNVSIVVTCEEQQLELRCLLPELLSMQYDGEYEVIVVDKIHDKDLKEWLEEMEVHFPHLCHTFCSPTAKGIDVHRFALTLGAKAANYEWIVVMPVDALLPDKDWLSRFTACCTDDVDVVKGIGRRSLWHRLMFNIFRRKLSVFAPMSSIFLCRRSLLLQANPYVPKGRITFCPIVK